MIIRDRSNKKDENEEEHPWKFSPGLASSSSSESRSDSQSSIERFLKRRSFEKLKVELGNSLQEPDPKLSNSTLHNFNSTFAAISSNAIIATDKNLNIIEWNPTAEKLFGWKASEVIGHNNLPETRAIITDALKKEETFKTLSAQGYWTGDIQTNNRDRQKLSVKVTVGVIWNEEGLYNGLAAEFQKKSDSIRTDKGDEVEKQVKQRTLELEKANRILQQELTIHKQTALLARESEGRNRDLVDNIRLGIFRCTPGNGGKFLEVNKAMEEISGYSREELLLIDVCKVWTNTAEGDPYLNEVSINDWKVTNEMQLTRKDGSKILVGKTVVAIRFDSGKIQYFDGILEDITERKHAQTQVQQSLQLLQKTIKEIIQAMAYIGEVRDPYTAGHQRRVAQLSFDIARSIGLSDQQYEGLTMAAFVHDIGKIMVPSDILSKPGKLTKPEFDMIKDHTRIGYEILKTIEFPWPIAEIVLQHHERMDGSGYPSGLKGDQIIMEARILAVADVVEAMSSHRPYRPALGIDKALNEINLNRGKLYDSDVVDACVKLFESKTYNLN